MEPQNDHDLIIELRADVKALRGDVKELKEGTAARLKALEVDHVSRRDHHDHEVRIRRLESRVWMAIGGLALLQLGLRFMN